MILGEGAASVTSLKTTKGPHSMLNAVIRWVFVFSVLEREPWAWGSLGKDSATELHPSKMPGWKQ